jgi:hypothetical protein
MARLAKRDEVVEGVHRLIIAAERPASRQVVYVKPRVEGE